MRRTIRIVSGSAIVGVSIFVGVTFGASGPATAVPPPPQISTQASAGVALGGQISDTALLGSAAAPTGTLTFRAFGPANPTCRGGAAFTSTVPVSHGIGYYTSGSFTPTTPGTYQWVASYSGDANNAPGTGLCGDANESVTVTGKGTPPPSPSTTVPPSTTTTLFKK